MKKRKRLHHDRTDRAKNEHGSSGKHRRHHISMGIGLWIITIYCLLMMVGMGTFSRYRKEFTSNGNGIAKSFYFTSELEQEQSLYRSRSASAVHELYGWTPGEEYTFLVGVQNYTDAYHVTEEPIYYEVKTPSSFTYKIHGESDMNGKIGGDGSLENQTIAITVPAGWTPDNAAYPAFNVVIQSVQDAAGKGYVKTISLRFLLVEGESYVECEAENHTDYVDLLLGVSGAGSVSIEWPAGLTPDNTNPYLTEATTPPYRIGFETVDSCRLRFLVTGALGDTDAFTVTADNVVKTVMIPR